MSGGTFVGCYPYPTRDWIYDEDDCEFSDDYPNDFPIQGNRKMAKDYMTSTGYAFDTEADAIDAAKKRANKNFEDVKIYRAYKIAKTTTPNVEVTDLVVA